MLANLKKYWFIIAESHELTKKTVLSRQICEEFLVCFRNVNGTVTVLRDRCLHRCGKLSNGYLRDGNLTCPYHGWQYDAEGKVVAIPAMGREIPDNLQSRSFLTKEQDGYVYVNLSSQPENGAPFVMQHYSENGWRHVRLQTIFENNLENCVENFIDIPHTAFVHEGIFRRSKNESIVAKVIRNKSEVHVSYKNEKQNLGSFNWFLNPKNLPITHTDSFISPNITYVSYSLVNKWHYVITSQSVPMTPTTTRVYTDLSYRFGFLTPFIGWLIKRQAKRVIDQDVDILKQQMQVIQRYGQHFYNTPADKIHQYVSEIIQSLYQNLNPADLPDQEEEVMFWV